MKTFSFQFHKERAALIDEVVALRNKTYREVDRLKIEWHPWINSSDILECSLTAVQLEIVSESLYFFGPDSIIARGIMDKIILVLLREVR